MNNIAKEIIEAGQKLYQSGFAPATSGNYSMRIDEQRIAITVSGKNKGQLTTEDVIEVDYHGKVLNSNKKPSDETLLHTVVYQLFPDAGAVLHTHSVSNTVLSRLYLKNAIFTVQDYELQKVFPNIKTHEGSIAIPIVNNSQDMPVLAQEVKQLLPSFKIPAYLIAGHGLYTWGATMADALRHVEGLEFLFNCELEFLRLR